MLFGLFFQLFFPFLSFPLPLAGKLRAARGRHPDVFLAANLNKKESEADAGRAGVVPAGMGRRRCCFTDPEKWEIEQIAATTAH